MAPNRSIIGITLVLAAAAPVAAQEAPPAGFAQSGYDTDGQSVDSIAVFFEPLSHYGRWLDTRFGRAWSPNVGRDWRPYTIGHWEAGPYGQTWRSDEPFGWAVFHFGRWGFDPAIGWVWTPDTVWGPGWVAWRDSDEVAGWAPLPPGISLGFAFGAGYGDGFNSWGYDQWFQPGWVYVPRAYLHGRSLRGAILPFGRNHEYWDGTRGVTRYDRVDGRVINRSFDDDRRRDDRRDAVRDTFARRFGERTSGVGGDLRAVAPSRRDDSRPAEGAPPYPIRGYGHDGLSPFVPPSRPQGFGGRERFENARRSAPPVATAPTGGAVIVRPPPAAAIRANPVAPRPMAVPQAQPPRPREVHGEERHR